MDLDIENGSQLSLACVGHTMQQSSMYRQYNRDGTFICLTLTIDTTAPNAVNNQGARVTVLDNIHLSDNAVDFLSLGPISFSISHRIDGSTFRKVTVGLHKLRDQLRIRTRNESNHQHTAPISRRALPPTPFPRNFYKEPEPARETDTKFRILLSGVLSAYNHHRRLTLNNLTREQWQGLKEIREMTTRGDIRLSVSDKGGEFVVMSQALDREITNLHLQDETIYRRVTEKEFLVQCKRLNHVWMTMGKSAGLDERFVSCLKLDKPTCPVFYSLIKTHKLKPDEVNSTSAATFKIRPIISCVGGPTDRISWFLNKIVSQILPKIPSHLSNTHHFLERLRNARVEGNCVIESFDVTSLYTNVKNSEALQALSEMIDLYGNNLETYGLSKSRIITLIKECLNCNIFRWSGNYFAQLRGLAMGQRLAPVLAIRFMSRIEEPVLSRRPIMYCRYIDDCCIITSTQSEMDECFRILNQQSQYIRLTRETPKEGWLPYLNTQISTSNGIIRVKWYRKESCKNIILHAKSAHPTAVKRAVIRNMFNSEVCTGNQERHESRRLALKIACANGHTRSIIQAQLQNDVILVNIPNANIKSQLVRNRLYDRYCICERCVICPYGKTGDCTKIGVIYEIECLICNATYVGETGRNLGVRINEHMAGKRRKSLITPLGRHRHEAHNGNDYDVKCVILAHETEISARKTLEAFFILKRNPSMNNKNECLSITNEFLPLVPLCDL
ncbi:hypothetical protein RB195_017272 [Necator americanus]|uniref:Reverse transcriptase domain-containing protein n=1 Tax=Necator americanus TaxID=51031 RepID=A0ABR1C708_NECAM